MCDQENNAIAEVDLKDKKITDIHGLGYKEWGSLDASDRDLGKPAVKCIPNTPVLGSPVFVDGFFLNLNG